MSFRRETPSKVYGNLKGGGGGGAAKKNMVCKGSLKIIYTFKCCNEGFCNSLKSCQNAQNDILRF